MSALFERSGDLLTPTERARGPWDPRFLHGGPVAALLAGALQETAGEDRQVVRVTVELMRPVPLAPMTLTTTRVREGRKLSLLEATLALAATGVPVASARASALRIAASDPIVPSLSIPGPDAGRAADNSLTGGDSLAFHSHGVEMRWVTGDWDNTSQARAAGVVVWFRLIYPVVAEMAITPWQRAAAAADFGNGISSVLPFEEYEFINPDVAIYLFRPPRGEWVGLSAKSSVGPFGSGIAESELFDEEGLIGRAIQSLLIGRREGTQS
jgi:hypothetical protein